MSIGLGIFLSTLIICALLIYRWYGEKWALWQKVRKMGMGIGIAVVVIAVCIGGYYVYDNYPAKQTRYYGLSLGMTKAEALYVLGTPSSVLGDLEPIGSGHEGGFHPEFKFDEIPDGKKLIDYNGWIYPGGPDDPVIRVQFDANSGKVRSIGCFSGDSNCQPILGIRAGMSEEDVVDRLGRPTTESIEGATKFTFYKGLNIRLWLTKKQVYALGIETTGEPMTRP